MISLFRVSNIKLFCHFLQLADDLDKTFHMINMCVDEVSEQEACNLSAQQIGTHLFELYLTLQEFCRFREHLSAA